MRFALPCLTGQVCLLMAGLFFCIPTTKLESQTLQKGSVLPALIWKDNSVKRNVTIVNAVGNNVILRVDGKLVPMSRLEFSNLYRKTQDNLDKIDLSVTAPAPEAPKKPTIPKPEDFSRGHVIPELIWKDGGLKKNVQVLNVVRGFHVLNVNGRTETISETDFQALLKVTAEHTDTKPLVPTQQTPTPKTAGTSPDQTTTTPRPSQPLTTPPAAPPTTPAPSQHTPPTQPPVDGTSLGSPPGKPVKDIETDEEVRFTFVFNGDTRPPAIDGAPTPTLPKPKTEPKPKTVSANKIDTTGWKHYGDDEEKPVKAKESIPLGIQWDNLKKWFNKNKAWTWTSAAVLFIGSLTLVIVGKVKKGKNMKVLQTQIAQRKDKRKEGGAMLGDRKFKKFKTASAPAPKPAVPPRGDHVYLCFTGHDHEAGNGLQTHLEDHGFEVRCRDLINGSGKIFDNDVVDNIETAQAVILVASENAYASQRVQMEIDLARDEKKKIVPVYLDDAELPDFFMDLANESVVVYFDPDDPDGSLEEIVAYIRMKGVKAPAVPA